MCVCVSMCVCVCVSVCECVYSYVVSSETGSDVSVMM